MLFFGHRFLKNQKFYHVFDIDSIITTPPASTMYIEFDENNLDIINYLQENKMNFALKVKTVTEIAYASSLGATYIVVESHLAKTAQRIAENYLFDSKILVSIQNEDEIEELVLLNVDGVIFPNAIVKVTP